ncbi:MAG TPA: hypothetical protein VF482_22090 [Trebonia sp.]
MARHPLVRSVSGTGPGGGPVTEPGDTAMRAAPSWPAARASERTVFCLLVFAFICGLGLLAALVPVGHGFAPKGGGWFIPAVVGGAITHARPDHEAADAAADGAASAVACALGRL